MSDQNSTRTNIGGKTFIRSFKSISPFEPGKQDGVIYELIEPQHKTQATTGNLFRNALISIGFFLSGLTVGFVFAVA